MQSWPSSQDAPDSGRADVRAVVARSWERPAGMYFADAKNAVTTLNSAVKTLVG